MSVTAAFRTRATLLTAELPPFTAVLHRESGITHLLVEPAPDILTALTGEPLTLADLRARLGEQFELADDEAGDGLAARLVELVAAGLVEAA